MTTPNSHLSLTGRQWACAGWLAVHGADHLTVRLAVAMGRLDPAALAPGDDWPPLWDDFGDMVKHMAGPRGVCKIMPPDARRRNDEG
jgi:hypothetical protein